MPKHTKFIHARRLFRETLIQLLFAFDFNDSEEKSDLISNHFLWEIVKNASNKSNSKQKINWTKIEEQVKSNFLILMENLEKIDERITLSSSNWRLDRMPAVDRNIIRVATYELTLCRDQVKPIFVINEAIEISKAYSGNDSSKFVNAVLDSINKDYQSK